MDQETQKLRYAASLRRSHCGLGSIPHEAIRDLVRARMDAVMQLMRARQHGLAFLLRHGRNYGPGMNWTLRHRRRLATQKFDQVTHQIVLSVIMLKQCGPLKIGAISSRRGYRQCCRTGRWRATLVEALRTVRGIDLISSVIFVAAVGDLGQASSSPSAHGLFSAWYLSNRAAAASGGRGHSGG